MAFRQLSCAERKGTQIGDETVLEKLRVRHDRGLYCVACDIEASKHYQIKETGLRTGLWRMRCYLEGFCFSDTARGALHPDSGQRTVLLSEWKEHVRSLMAAGAGAMGNSKGSVADVFVVVIRWMTCQTLATLILSIEERSNDGPEAPVAKQEHGRTARAARKPTRR